MVDGKPVKPNFKIKPLQKITIILPRPRGEGIRVFPQNIPLNIVYEDDDLMVINKPAGMPVHPGVGNYKGTLVNALAYHFRNLPVLDGNDEDRLGLVHRIDKNTTGLMVVAAWYVSGHVGYLAEHPETLEEAFIGYLIEAGGDAPEAGAAAPAPVQAEGAGGAPAARARRAPFSVQRMISYLWRESLELQRDPIRASLALGGSILLMFVIGFGISMDVEDLRYAVLDRDQTTLSRDYALQLSGSRYFIEQPPISNYAELDRRMRSGELTLAIEIPHGFMRDALRGNGVQIAAWVDGAMPARAETVEGYVQGMHQSWLAKEAATQGIGTAPAASVETRFRYNPDVKSLPAMVPAVIPMLLLMLPAMLTALAVVREKETGSITNLYVTPVTRSEFLLGKQLPYVGLAMINFGLMALLAVTIFGVPITGSFLALALAALIFSFAATGMGLLASSVTNSQIAAMFLAMIGTIIPATQFSGLLDPVSSLEGSGKLIGEIYPATHMITISRGVFNKALGFADLSGSLWQMLLSVPVILGAAIALLKKQER